MTASVGSRQWNSYIFCWEDRKEIKERHLFIFRGGFQSGSGKCPEPGKPCRQGKEKKISVPKGKGARFFSFRQGLLSEGKNKGSPPEK